MTGDGALQRRRRQQAADWLDAALRDLLVRTFLADAGNAAALAAARAAVRDGTRLPHAAARELVTRQGAP